MVNVNDFCKQALKLLGNPYLWGGNGESLADVLRLYATAKGQSEKSTQQMIDFISDKVSYDLNNIHLQDCSGLVYEILKLLGAKVSDETAEGLWKKCKHIAKPRKGALAFYFNGKKHNHVGICISDTEIVHCLNTKVGVIREPISKRDEWVDFGLADYIIDYNPVEEDTITLAKDVYVYNTADEAVKNNHNSETIIYHPNVYYIYKTYKNCTNISRNKGVAGGWIRNDLLQLAEEW